MAPTACGDYVYVLPSWINVALLTQSNLAMFITETRSSELEKVILHVYDASVACDVHRCKST